MLSSYSQIWQFIRDGEFWVIIVATERVMEFVAVHNQQFAEMMKPKQQHKTVTTRAKVKANGSEGFDKSRVKVE